MSFQSDLLRKKRIGDTDEVVLVQCTLWTTFIKLVSVHPQLVLQSPWFCNHQNSRDMTIWLSCSWNKELYWEAPYSSKGSPRRTVDGNHKQYELPSVRAQLSAAALISGHCVQRMIAKNDEEKCGTNLILGQRHLRDLKKLFSRTTYTGLESQ